MRGFGRAGKDKLETDWNVYLVKAVKLGMECSCKILAG